MHSKRGPVGIHKHAFYVDEPVATLLCLLYASCSIAEADHEDGYLVQNMLTGTPASKVSKGPDAVSLPGWQYSILI